MSQLITLSPRDTLAGPTPPAAVATEEYGRSVAVLTAAERALSRKRCPELERTVLVASEYVLACRVQAGKALLEAGIRLDQDTLHTLEVDEALVNLSAEWWLSLPGTGVASAVAARRGLAQR